MAHQSTPGDYERQKAAHPEDLKKCPDRDLPENCEEKLEEKLDHALEETFPTSDPVSVKITK